MSKNKENFNKANFIKRFAENLTRLRKAKGLSHDRLTLECGIPRGTLSRIERGIVEPRIGTVGLIASALDVPVKRLFDFE